MTKEVYKLKMRWNGHGARRAGSVDAHTSYMSRRQQKDSREGVFSSWTIFLRLYKVQVPRWRISPHVSVFQHVSVSASWGRECKMKHWHQIEKKGWDSVTLSHEGDFFPVLSPCCYSCCYLKHRFSHPETLQVNQAFLISGFEHNQTQMIAGHFLQVPFFRKTVK